MMQMISTLATGGHYWPASINGDGHSLIVPHGCAFKVAMNGASSRFYTTGLIDNGWHLVSDGPLAGQRFQSANAAVNKVRAPINTDAFLYIQYAIDGWLRADDMRHDDAFKPNPAEEEALNVAVELLKDRSSPRRVTPDLVKRAAVMVQARPDLQNLGKRLADLALIDITSMLEKARLKKPNGGTR